MSESAPRFVEVDGEYVRRDLVPTIRYAVEDPARVEQLDAFYERDHFELAPADPERQLEQLDRLDASYTHAVKDYAHSDVDPSVSCYQYSLDLYHKLIERGDGYLERCRTRHALARYLRDVVAPSAELQLERTEYRELADKLEHARPWGLWGVDFMSETLVVEWTQRAGLVKLCPDDARDNAMRAAACYGERLESLQAEGCEIRFAVFTLPNFPRWHLGSGMDAIFNQFRDRILYARADGRIARRIDDRKRMFPSLVGAVATLEAPLSRHGDWNVHLNVLLVFRSRPDYKALREAWGANVEFRTVPTGAGAAALRELVKYPLKAISLKSDEKARQGSSAPPVIEWPADAFDEWWRAHKGFRRMRNWGVLYHSHLPKDPPRSRESVDWIGRVKVTPAGFDASYPQRASFDRVDLILGNKSAPIASRSGRPEGRAPPFDS